MNNRITIKNISNSLVYTIGDNFRRELHFIVVNGIKDEDAVVVQDSSIYDVKTIAEMYDNKDYAAFAKFIPNATMAEKDTAIQLAVQKGITDNGFTALIKKYCDVDVISAINFKHLAEEK